MHPPLPLPSLFFSLPPSGVKFLITSGTLSTFAWNLASVLNLVSLVLSTLWSLNDDVITDISIFWQETMSLNYVLSCYSCLLLLLYFISKECDLWGIISHFPQPSLCCYTKSILFYDVTWSLLTLSYKYHTYLSNYSKHHRISLIQMIHAWIDSHSHEDTSSPLLQFVRNFPVSLSKISQFYSECFIFLIFKKLRFSVTWKRWCLQCDRRKLLSIFYWNR